MVPGGRRSDGLRAGRERTAEYARDRREALGLTQAEVAARAGVKDVKTVRNFETGRNWPNDLTLRAFEHALQLESGQLDRIADGPESTGAVQFGGDGNARVGGPALPSSQELIDLSAVISTLSSLHTAALRRGDDEMAEQVQARIDSNRVLMGLYRSALQKAAFRAERTDSSPFI